MFVQSVELQTMLESSSSYPDVIGRDWGSDEADSIGNLAYLITNEKHKPVRDVRADLPASASRIVNKTLQKNPDDRYSSGKELADAILRGMPGNERNK